MIFVFVISDMIEYELDDSSKNLFLILFITQRVQDFAVTISFPPVAHC